MKKLLSLALILAMALAACFAFVACDDENENPNNPGNTGNEKEVVIVVSSDVMTVTSETKLIDYMNALKEEGKIDFEISNGMVMSINGKSGESNEYWMLYTDDTENSNDSWGTYTYEEKSYGSATLGAEALPIKEGKTYIWALQTFGL